MIPIAKDRFYFDICIVKFFLIIISLVNDFKAKLIKLFAMFPQIDLGAMGVPTSWKKNLS